MIKAIIFDVDGTLVDTVAIHAKAWQEAFRDHGHEIGFDQLRGQIGKGGDQLMPVFLSPSEVEKEGKSIDERRAQILKDRYLDGIKAFSGVRDLFKRLRSDGVHIVLASSAKGDDLATYKAKADIADIVEEETSSDDAERSKPAGDIFQAALDRIGGIDLKDVVVVGDTPYDAIAAGKVGLRTIGVLCGGFPEKDLRDAGCIAIFRDPADLLARYGELVG